MQETGENNGIIDVNRSGISGGSTAPPNTTRAPNRPPSAQNVSIRRSLPALILFKLIAIFTIFLRIFLYPLRKLSYMFFPPKELDGYSNATVADLAAAKFVHHFQSRYLSTLLPPSSPSDADSNTNSQSCPFVTKGYNSTITSVLSSPPSTTPLLLIYLHSPLHRDVDNFCQKTLCNHRVLAYLNGENYVSCLAESVHSAEGSYLSTFLGVCSYPFVALLSVKSRSSSSSNANPPNVNNATMELLLRMEGEALTKLRPEQFVAYIGTTVRRHKDALEEVERRRLQREEEARLREEQDREFQEALLADQQREIARREEEERIRLEQLRIEEETRNAEEEAALKLTTARSMVRDEPPKGGSEPTARVRLTLPNGKRIDRRFYASDTVDVIRAFLIVRFHEQEIPIENFSLSTNFPKKTFDDGSLTLKEAGLCPQAVMMIQDLDA
uniref:UBX domain-containing protein n=1 Tax=Ditylum brightwellii TaxID=49249 RepID=A0A6U3S7I6_9STRA|mmetsp:Transcript_28780/g.42761  ORF Transcript_28780/g.42761 Transcript_28780/m.42761 type:complete len:442 (+) Transcript_28780:145-1470(+)